MISHLYAHIPFCHKICPYCGFFKHTPSGFSQKHFVDAMLKEAQNAPYPIDWKTIYLGGGTPSLLGFRHLQTLLAGLRQIAGNTLLEFTMEANPRTFTAKKAALMRREGVTRVSLGVQAWDAPTLKVLGRDHTAHTAETAWNILRDAGFPSLNLDLMFSVPGLTLDEWEHSIDRSLRLAPNHISAYNLTYEEDTDFLRRFEAGKLDASEDRDATQYHAARETLIAAGMEHYETSNYAQPGHQSLHNLAYWQGADFLGIGPGAVSTVGLRRWTNVKDTAQYVALIQKHQRAESEIETLTPHDKAVEWLGMNLRLATGIDPTKLTTFAGAPDRFTKLSAEGFWEPASPGKVRLVPHKSALVDSVAEYLLG